MKRNVIIIWIVVVVLVVIFACVGWIIFRNNQTSALPTSIPTAISMPTAIPSATSLPPIATSSATSIPPTVIPSATSVPPTAIPSATSVTPTVKPSATSMLPTARPSATHLPPTVTVNPVQNILWQWVSVSEQSTNTQVVVPNPANYTITFYADGTLTGLADCNTFKGTYSQKNGFTIKIGVSTSAYCGETSLDRQYLQLLGNISAGGPDGAGGLALETAGGAQRMQFKNGGAAVKP
jgi:heat shock protein HslJ